MTRGSIVPPFAPQETSLDLVLSRSTNKELNLCINATKILSWKVIKLHLFITTCYQYYDEAIL